MCARVLKRKKSDQNTHSGYIRDPVIKATDNLLKSLIVRNMSLFVVMVRIVFLKAFLGLFLLLLLPVIVQ